MGNRKWYAVAVIVLLALCAVAAWYLRDEAPATPGVVAAEIRYTDDGYVPSEVTIRKGEAVRWINDSTRDMWPASAVHPTHSLYPEKSDSDCLGSSFDACDYLAPGTTWEYTFHTTGDWRFHDHVRASRTGIVHVTE